MECLVNHHCCIVVLPPVVTMAVYTQDLVRQSVPELGSKFYNWTYSPVHNNAAFVDFAFVVPKACFIVVFQVENLSVYESSTFELLLSCGQQQYKQHIPCRAELLSSGKWRIRSDGIPMREPKYKIHLGSRSS